MSKMNSGCSNIVQGGGNHDDIVTYNHSESRLVKLSEIIENSYTKLPRYVGIRI